MATFFRFVGLLALISAAFGLFEVVITSGPGATVFQQIAARVNIGLSALVMIVAFGFAAILDAIPKAARAGSGSGKAASSLGGTPVAKHAGINIFRDGEAFAAIVNGERITGGTMGSIRAEIDARLPQSS